MPHGEIQTYHSSCSSWKPGSQKKGGKPEEHKNQKAKGDMIHSGRNIFEMVEANMELLSNSIVKDEIDKEKKAKKALRKDAIHHPVLTSAIKVQPTKI